MVKLEGFTTTLTYKLDNGESFSYGLIAKGITNNADTAIKYFTFEYDKHMTLNNLVFVDSSILEEVLNFIKTIGGEEG